MGINRTLYYDSFEITLSYGSGIIHIINNIDLWRFFDADVVIRTQWLINAIQQDYLALFGKPLEIRNRSFAVEIWGHLYAEYYLLKISRFFGKIAPKKLQYLIQRSASIDCGEKNIDNNRFLWDFLALGYIFFVYILPRNISSEGLKK